jgi:acetylornithine deacetylase/succinyl-diaminopimelate desuccinylase-like protein
MNLLERLEAYVTCESPTGDVEALTAFTERLAEDFNGLGGAVRTVPSSAGPHLIIDVDGIGQAESDAPILVLAHSDTVWPRGTLESMPWRVDAGRAFGPGCFDMKGGIVALQGALELLEADGRTRRPIRILVVADEEVGSPTSRHLVEDSAGSAIAVLGLEPAHPDGSVKTARFGSTRVRLAVTGREAHAALDAASGVSAIDELTDQLVRLRPLVARPGVLSNVGTIAGGGRTNVVAGSAHAEIGLRFRDADTEREVLEAIGRVQPIRPDAEVSVTVLSSRPAWTPDPRHDALCATVAAAAASIGQSVSGRPASGAADTNISGNLGIPSIDGLGPVGAGAHAAHEQVEVASLQHRAELIAATVVRLSDPR